MNVREIPDDDRSLTIDEFCQLNHMSRTFYFRLRKQGNGPEEMRFGAHVRITPESNERWRKKYTRRINNKETPRK
jgi:hypothetical protein